MQQARQHTFETEIPPDVAHAPMVREEALDWLDANFAGASVFATGDVLRMAGETGRRWLIGRLRSHGIANDEEITLPDAADALAVLFLRSRGVKFREAVDAVLGGRELQSGPRERYGGVWNWLIITALDRLRRRVPQRLLGAGVAALLPDPAQQPNALVLVKRHGRGAADGPPEGASTVGHDYVYRLILERPGPACAVVEPFREILFLGRDQPPARSEVTSRHFTRLRIETSREVYELLIGTMRPVSVASDRTTIDFVGRALDIAFLRFEEFQREQASFRFETAIEPDPASADDLQIWLMSRFLLAVYPGSLTEISEVASNSGQRVLASSAVRPWESTLWEPSKGLEMLSSYASRVGVPLVVERVEYPLTTVIQSIDSELRFLRNAAGDPDAQYSAVALPIISRADGPVGSFYVLLPELSGAELEAEVRLMLVFSRLTGEIIERQRAAVHSADVYNDIATYRIMKKDELRDALRDLLARKAQEIRGAYGPSRDLRLPFLLLAAHGPDVGEGDPPVAGRLKDWLGGTLRYLEWHSFVRTHLASAPGSHGPEGFVGELPGVGVMIALDELVSKDELDRIRSAFPTTINSTTPDNAPVKLVAWVLDLPAHRIADAAESGTLPALAEDVERWAFDVTSVVEDVAQSFTLALEQGEWESALRRIRRTLRKKEGSRNAYLHRRAAECAFAMADWPSALRYAQRSSVLSEEELGSGRVRSLCKVADAYLCMGDPQSAWDSYTEAVVSAPVHPLPRYYRGQGLLLIARLVDVYADERRRAGNLDPTFESQVDAVLTAIVDVAMEDLSTATDFLDQWGVVPGSYPYGSSQLVGALIGQGAGYLLTRAPGPAAGRLQSARRSFPKDDLLLREFIFAKCWEQGVHRKYGELLTGEGTAPFMDRLGAAFGGTATHEHRA